MVLKMIVVQSKPSTLAHTLKPKVNVNVNVNVVDVNLLRITRVGSEPHTSYSL